MPFDSNGKWSPPGGKWAAQQHQEDVQQAEQMSPDEIARRQAGNQMDTEPLPTPPQDDSQPDDNQSSGDTGNWFIDSQRKLYNSTLAPLQDFFNRAAGAAVNSMTMDLTKKPMQDNPLAPDEIKDVLTEPTTTSEKVADTLGTLGGFLVPGEGAYATGGKLATKGIERLAPDASKWVSDLVRGAGAGATYGTADQALDAAFDTHGDGDQTLGQRLENVGLNAALFGGGDAALNTIGRGIASTDLYKNWQLANAIKALEPTSKDVAEELINRPASIYDVKPQSDGVNFEPQLALPMPKGSIADELQNVAELNGANFYTPQKPLSPIDDELGKVLNERAGITGETPVTETVSEPYLKPNEGMSGKYRVSNPASKQLEELYNLAQERGLPPGREYEYLQGLWSEIAPREAGTLDDLIQQASKETSVQDMLNVGRQRMSDAQEAAKYGVYPNWNIGTPALRDVVNTVKKEPNFELRGGALVPVEKPITNAEMTRGQLIDLINRSFKGREKNPYPTFEGNNYKLPEGTKDPRLNSIVSSLKKNENRTIPNELGKANVVPNETAGIPAEGVKGFFGKFNPLNGLQKSEETIARNQVVNNIRKNLGVPISTGRLTSRGAQGEYKVQPEVIRTARAEDISTIAHEIGHHLEKNFQLVDPVYQKELEKIAAPLVKGNKAYTPADHAEEGLAEFFRRYLTEDHAQLKKDAPKLFDHLTNKLEGQKLEVKGKKYDVMKGLNQAREDIQKWINQGEFNQAVGKMDFNGKEDKPPFSLNKFITQFVDDLNPLKVFEKDLTGKVGLGKNSVYKLARNSRGIAEQAKVALERGVYLNGEKIGDGLEEIVKPLEKLGVSQEQFATYLAVKQSRDLKDVHGKNVAFTDEEMKAVMDRFDGTEVEKVQQAYVKYNRDLLRVLEDAGIIKQGTTDFYAQKYPNYAPLQRYFDDDAIAGFKDGGFGAAKGFANLSNPVKRMTEEGSTRTIVNPLESTVKNTFLVMNAAAKNKVGLRLAEMSKIDGAGAWVEHLGEGGRDGKEHIVTVFQDGTANQYKVRDPELYSAMLSLDHESSSFLIRGLGSIASVLRSGATLTPEFMARNAVRDLTEAFINTGMNPLLFAKGFYHVMRKDEMFDKFLASGGGQSVLMSLDRNYNREALKEIFHESIKDKAMNVITSPKELAKLMSGYTPAKLIVKGLRKGAEVSELSTRLGQFERVLNKTGDIDEAAYQARDLMDFNKAGNNIRQWNKAAAFMNAGIQGVDKMARSFWGNGVFDVKSKASYLTRAVVSLVLPAVGLYQLKQHLIENDPEWKRLYENIPQWQKDSFFIIPMPGHWFARIPKPFEAGMLYATGTERLMDFMHGQDPKAKEYFKGLLGAFTPNALPTMLMPLLEGITNYSFFQGRSIIPTSEQKLQKEDQYGINTSETAKLLGKGASNVPILKDTNFASPRIIDNTLHGYTAGLGQYAISGIDAALNALGISKPIPKPAQESNPLIKAFTVNTQGGGQVRQDFYDKFNELSQEKASDKKNQTPLTGQDAKDYARMNSVKTSIDRLVKVYKQAQADPKLDPQQKRQILDGLDQKMDALAKIGLNRK